MMVWLTVCLIVLKCFELAELYQLRISLRKNPQEYAAKEPPKARESFVVKRFEEKIKEALYK